MRYAYRDGYSQFQTYRNYPAQVFEHLVKNLRCNSISGWFFSPDAQKGGSFCYQTKGTGQIKTVTYADPEPLKAMYYCPELQAYIFPEEHAIPECVAAFYDTMYYSEAIAHLSPVQDGYYDLMGHFENLYS